MRVVALSRACPADRHLDLLETKVFNEPDAGVVPMQLAVKECDSLDDAPAGEASMEDLVRCPGIEGGGRAALVVEDEEFGASALELLVADVGAQEHGGGSATAAPFPGGRTSANRLLPLAALAVLAACGGTPDQLTNTATFGLGRYEDLLQLGSRRWTTTSPRGRARKGIQVGPSGLQMTEWELWIISQHPEWWPRVTLWYNGVVQAHPWN